MSQELRHVCEHCNGAMTYQPEWKSMAVECPHCKAQTILGGSTAPSPATSQSPPPLAESKRSKWTTPVHEAEATGGGAIRAEAEGLGLLGKAAHGLTKNTRHPKLWFRVVFYPAIVLFIAIIVWGKSEFFPSTRERTQREQAQAREEQAAQERFQQDATKMESIREAGRRIDEREQARQSSTPAAASEPNSEPSPKRRQAIPSVQTEFDTSEKSIKQNGNAAVAVQKLLSESPKTIEKSSVADVTKNPYASLGKVVQFSGQVYKVEALPPNPDMAGSWAEILVLVRNPNSPIEGVTTVSFLYRGDIAKVNAGNNVTFSGYFVGTYNSKNALGGQVEALMLVGDSLRRF